MKRSTCVGMSQFAILVGDLMLGMTFELLASAPADKLGSVLALHADTVRVLCEGQVDDMQFEERLDVSNDAYLAMIDQKTGHLLSASLVLGATLGSADSEDIETLRRIGHHSGRAFQIMDDLLDCTAEGAAWGKPVGGDLLAGKKTWLLTKAIETAPEPDRIYWTDTVASGKLAPEDLSEALRRLEQLGILASAEKAVIFHTEKAFELLNTLPEGQARNDLSSLLESLSAHTH